MCINKAIWSIRRAQCYKTEICPKLVRANYDRTYDEPTIYSIIIDDQLIIFFFDALFKYII